MMTQALALAVGISRADAWLRRLMDAQLGAVHGLGYTDFLVLAEISSVVGQRMRSVDLAKRLMLTPSGVTRALIPLEKIGLIARRAHDRDARAAYVSLTPAGHKRLAEALPTAERIVGEAFDAALTPAAQLTVLGFFERLGYAGA
ncbi:MAG: MarR family transcriptional regulator [Candidatus Eremiobacteraeota bacterium]|nr:MarR family transcriptional regulator [Candidatus Eremiobacteraeota bacterium]